MPPEWIRNNKFFVSRVVRLTWPKRSLIPSLWLASDSLHVTRRDGVYKRPMFERVVRGSVETAACEHFIPEREAC